GGRTAQRVGDGAGRRDCDVQWEGEIGLGFRPLRGWVRGRGRGGVWVRALGLGAGGSQPSRDVQVGWFSRMNCAGPPSALSRLAAKSSVHEAEPEPDADASPGPGTGPGTGPAT